MDVNKFLNYLYQKRLLLIVIPVLTVIITFFLSKNLLDSYRSEAEIATGLVDETQQLISGNEIKESTINQRFSNLIEIMKLKKMMDQISYQLILHDLTNKKPYRKPSQEIKDLNASARRHAIEVYSTKYKNREPLSLWDRDQRGLAKVIASMKYDEESLQKKLNVYRNGNSDFITITFDSENPELSAFVVNTLAKEFIVYYNIVNRENEIRGINFLGQLLNQKRDSLNQKMEELKNYKIQNNVINLNEQSRILYSQILANEGEKLEAQKKVDAYSQTLNNINSKFSSTDRQYLESAMVKINQQIISTKQQLRSATDQYIADGFDSSKKQTLDSLQEVLEGQVNMAADRYLVTPLASKEKLVIEKLNLELENDIAKYSINKINDHLNTLNSRFRKLVPFDAVVQSLERDIDVASQEYLDVLNKYNDSNMQSNYKTKLKLIQPAMPGLPQPSKKMLLVILSGIISFIFCTGILFVIFWFDKSIEQSSELEKITGQSLLGELSHIDFNDNLKEIWANANLSPTELRFKNQMRSIRFDIKKNLLYKKDKILAVSSLSKNDGKSFVALNMAYSFALLNKKVLIIDGDFNHPELSESATHKVYIEDFIKSGYIPNDALITIMANKGGDVSLLEMIDEQNIDRIFADLKDKFDIIILDTTDLKNIDKAKEWLLYADKIIGVYRQGKPLEDNKLVYTEYLGESEKFIGWIFNDVKKKQDGSNFFFAKKSA